jgi:hypothetical protein
MELTLGIVALQRVEVVLTGTAILLADFGIADCDVYGLAGWDLCG